MSSAGALVPAGPDDRVRVERIVERIVERDLEAGDHRSEMKIRPAAISSRT